MAKSKSKAEESCEEARKEKQEKVVLRVSGKVSKARFNNR